MSQATLVVHAGGNLCTVEDLRNLAPSTPKPEGKWHPTAHIRVFDTVVATLRTAGYQVQKAQLAVARNGHRFFGALDLSTPLVSGVSLAVGIRNSTDKSFPLGFAAGSRVFICDNLAFRSELMVKRKHTRFG